MHTTAKESLRLDVWLWASRWYKTRRVAADAVRTGRVWVNGQRAKPGRSVSLGDCITVRRGPYTFVVDVRGLSPKRLGAKEAIALYAEQEDSRALRETLRTQLQQARLAQPHYDGVGRPSKRDRRLLERLRREKA